MTLAKSKNHPGTDVARAKEGLLVFLRMALFLPNEQWRTESRLKEFMRAEGIAKFEVLPTHSRQRIPNPFRSDEATIHQVIEELAKEGLIEGDKYQRGRGVLGMRYHITEAGIAEVKRKYGKDLPTRFDEFTTTPSENKRWKTHMDKYGHGDGRYEENTVSAGVQR